MSSKHLNSVELIEALLSKVSRLERRLSREKNTRIQAEHLLEEKSKELFDKGQQLKVQAIKLAKQTSQLEVTLQKERELNELQRSFVAMASHEFRTPLAIIDGSAQKVLRRANRITPDELYTVGNKMRDAVKRMIRLIDSTLSAARMEAGKFQIHPEDCDIAEVLSDCCDHQRELTDKHKISLQVSALPSTIVADPKSLDMIFSNLLTNAVKYSPHADNISVQAKTENGFVIVSVQDYGLGIEESEQAKVFLRFFRASTSTGISGTGIGLNLVKMLVEEHGGKVSVTSKIGEGSTFIVKLPISGPVSQAHKAVA